MLRKDEFATFWFQNVEERWLKQVVNDSKKHHSNFYALQLKLSSFIVSWVFPFYFILLIISIIINWQLLMWPSFSEAMTFSLTNAILVFLILFTHIKLFNFNKVSKYMLFLIEYVKIANLKERCGSGWQMNLIELMIRFLCMLRLIPMSSELHFWLNIEVFVGYPLWYRMTYESGVRTWQRKVYLPCLVRDDSALTKLS